MGPAGAESGPETARYIMLHREGELAVPNGGGSVSFDPILQSDDIGYGNGIIRLPGPGVYQLLYQINFPVAARVRTVLSLRLGEQLIPGSVCHVDKENPGQPFTAMGQAIVIVNGPQTLSLHSSRGFVITGAAAGDTLASLSAVGIA